MFVIIKQSGRKPNKTWADEGGEFYKRDCKQWISDHAIIMYSTYNEGKSVVAERFIRTLKNKLYKHMTATGKNVYYDVLRKNIFACLFSVHNTISLSRHEQVCLMRLRFERYFSHHRAM